MKYLIMLLSFLLILTACAPKSITLDDARQIAVDRILTDDNYVQNDGHDFKELEANQIECQGCYMFLYEYSINEEYVPGVKGYSVSVNFMNSNITNIIFTEIKSDDSNLPPIQDRFDEFCENKCGDGFCDDVVCQGEGCICEESASNCPEDC